MGCGFPLDDPAKAYTKGRLKFELKGEKLGGLWNLVRTHMPGKQEQWFLIKHQDSAARPDSEYDVVAAEPDSVLSDRTIVEKNTARKSPIRSKKAPAKARKEKVDTTDGGAQSQPAGVAQTRTGNAGRIRAERRMEL